MSRLAIKSDATRSGRYPHQLSFHKRSTVSNQGSSTPPKFNSTTQLFSNHNSHYRTSSQPQFRHQFSGRTTSANLNYTLNQISDLSSEEGELEEEPDELQRRSIKNIKLGIPTRSMQPSSTPTRSSINNKSIRGSGGRRKSSGGAGGSGKKNGRNGERKASVRKQDYHLEAVLGMMDDDEEDDESDLTDVPSMEGKGEDRSEQGQNSDSDPEMEAKLRAAGDGESLLGSANSDQDSGEEIEEEQYIIEDTLLREAKARARAQQAGRIFNGLGGSSRGRGGGHSRGARSGNSAQRKNDRDALDEDGQDADEEEGNDEADDEMDGTAPSWSPETMKLLGLPIVDQDELFEEQDGFHSSSEPSFTDFFGSSDDEDSNAREDDDESTDDDLGGSEDEISDLDGGILGAPFLAHFTTTQNGSDLLNGLKGRQGGELIAAAGGENATGSNDPSSLVQQAEVPLLVIEDLDGRLIYARAGDGEAVFGSDGEFEFVDESDEDDTEDEMTLNGLGRGRSGVLDEETWRELGIGPSDIGDESGDTTDELPDEDMPFPRLLVGSVAPHGGRAARRARAMAAKSRMLSPSGGNTPRGRQRSREHSSSIGSRSNQNGDVALALELPASSESVNGDSVMAENKTLAQDQDKDRPQEPVDVFAEDQGTLPRSSSTRSTEPTTPEAKEQELPDSSYPKPEMGSFMPASSKSVHRAVIDGAHKAPSPFASRLALQSRGLSRKRNQRRDSSSTQSSKRPRRFSLDGTSSVNHGNGTASEAPSSPERALHSASEATAEIDAMDLDDVVEASMLWRGDRSKSPSADEDVADQTEAEENSDVGSFAQGSNPVMTAKAAKEARRMAKGKGKEIDVKSKSRLKSSSSSNAFARWDKIPLGAFRDTQSSRGGSSSSRHREAQSDLNRATGTTYSHRLGTFLLTAASSRSGSQHPVESSFSVNRSSGRQNQESSPFRGRREAISAEQALSFAMGGNTLLDLERARTAASANGHGGRDATFIVSPVLFPVRHRRSSQMGGLGTHDPDGDIDSVRLPEALSPSGQSSVLGASDIELNLGGTVRRSDLAPGRITKREKREKRARRAAAQLQMQIALAAQAEMAQQQIQSRSMGDKADTTVSTPPVNDENERKELTGSASSNHSQANNDDSPAASLAMPRLSITDASPRTSPGVQVPVAPLPKRFQREGSASLKGSMESSKQLTAGPLSPASSMLPPSATASSQTRTSSTGDSSQSQPHTQMSPVLRPPSSSFGGPLHSPLFGGIGMYGPQGAEEGDGEGEQVAALSI